MTSDFEKILNEFRLNHIDRRSFLLSIPFLLAACSSTQKNDSTELSIAEEKNLGKEAFSKLRRDYPALQDAEIQTYLAKIGEHLVKTNGLDNNPFEYSFTVVNAPSVNAFALPAGRVFVTAPLLAAVESEAELAGVLGHEIGHITAHHAALRMRAEQNSKSESWLYGVGGTVAGGVVGGLSSSIICPQSPSSCAEGLIQIGMAAGLSGGLLIHKYKFLANNQQNELEADRLGFEIAKKAEYSISQIGEFYRRQQKILESHNKNKTPIKSVLIDGMSTHPPSAARVQQLDQLIARESSIQKGKVSSLEFDQIRKRVQSIHAN